MNILAVDTTTPFGSVALLSDGELRLEINWESRTTHSSRLLRSIDFVLGASGLDIREIDGFALAVGPGSFTGIRIGLSAVKSLAFASGKPVAPVSTLLALASKPSPAEARLVSPLLDAKRGEIYAALYGREKPEPEEILPQGAYAPDEFIDRLPARESVLFLGSGLAVHGERLKARLGDTALLSPRTPFIAAEVGLIGGRVILAGGGVSPGSIEPLYFRKSQAEEKQAR